MVEVRKDNHSQEFVRRCNLNLNSLATAEQQGSLTATEIAAILDADELPVTAEME